MDSNKNSLSKEKSEYIKRNKVLLQILDEAHELFDKESLTYEEITKKLEERKENTIGLMIRLEQGVKLNLIRQDGTTILKERHFYIEERPGNEELDLIQYLYSQ